jgi:hypothetical protein
LSCCHAVGSQPHFLYTPDFYQFVEKEHHIPSDQWLTAGDTHLFDTQSGKNPAQSQHLFIREQIGSRQPVQTVFGHAVGTPQVAAISNCKSQVSKWPVVVIEKQSVREGVFLAKIGLQRIIGKSNFCSKLASENNSGYPAVSLSGFKQSC